MIKFYNQYVTKHTFNNLIKGEPKLLYEETYFKITPDGIIIEGRGFTQKGKQIVKFANRGFATIPAGKVLKKGSIIEIVWTDKAYSAGSEKNVLHKTLVQIKDVDSNNFVTRMSKISDTAQDENGQITVYKNSKLAFGNWVSCILLGGITTKYSSYL